MSSDFDTGLKAYNQMKYEDAFLIFSYLAEQGNPDAQCQLGLMYTNGEGVSLDGAGATRWLRSAAEQGNVTAQYMLDEIDEAAYYFNVVTEPRRAAVRECSTDAERILKAVGEEALRQGLPASLLAVLESDGVELSGVQVAEAAIATYHTDALRHYRRALSRLDPPRHWVGSERAVDFVRSLGFSTEWAGERKKEPRSVSGSGRSVFASESS
jgi:TPR repeat protein